jgi:translation initiation factor IF-1
LSEDEGEIYSIVMKCLGNNMFHCLGVDNILRLGHIRGKFSGRGRRDNTISPGSWILVGIRAWDTGKVSASGKTKLPECDLMEVYNEQEKSRLRDTVTEDWNVLISNDNSRKGVDSKLEMMTDDIFHFTTDKEIEVEQILTDMKSDKTEKIKLTDDIIDGDDEIINFDEI